MYDPDAPDVCPRCGERYDTRCSMAKQVTLPDPVVICTVEGDGHFYFHYFEHPNLDGDK